MVYKLLNNTRQFACDPGSFTHIYTNTGVYTITASTIDGSFTGTQDVAAYYTGGQLSVTPSTDELETGGTLSIAATFSDAAGHHVQEWYVNWGDGTSQAFGSVGDTSNPSDSSTDGTDADPASADSETFTHVYPTGRFTMGYNFAVYAVTDENAYGYANDVEVTNVNPFSDDFAVFPYNTAPGQFGEEITDGLHDAGLNLSATDAGSFTIDWGDGKEDSGIALTPNSNGVITLPTADSHDYAIEGTYLVTVTDHTNDGQTLVAHVPVFADSPIASIGTAAPVVGAGANLGIQVPVSDGDSQDPLFAVMQWSDSSGPAGPHVVQVNNGAIDLTNVAAPMYTSNWAMNLTVYNGDVGEQTDAPGQGGFAVYVWSIVIGDGSQNNILIASPDGTQNLQTVTLNIPHPAGEALDLTLTMADDTDDDVWDTDTPGPDDTPVLGDGVGSYAFKVAPDVQSLPLAIGSTSGNPTPGIVHLEITGIPDIILSTPTFLIPYAQRQVTGGGSGGTKNPTSDVSLSILALPTHELVSDGATHDVMVGDDIDLQAKLVAPPEFEDAAVFKWDVAGNVLYDWHMQGATESYYDIDPASPPECDPSMSLNRHPSQFPLSR